MLHCLLSTQAVDVIIYFRLDPTRLSGPFGSFYLQALSFSLKRTCGRHFKIMQHTSSLADLRIDPQSSTQGVLPSTGDQLHDMVLPDTVDTQRSTQGPVAGVDAADHSGAGNLHVAGVARVRAERRRVQDLHGPGPEPGPLFKGRRSDRLVPDRRLRRPRCRPIPQGHHRHPGKVCRKGWRR